tara:strand:- start:470 stop:1507 length:1038 start_codon:yes stop_codon:yes gene_type:complete
MIKKLKIKSKIHNYDVFFEKKLSSIFKKIPRNSIFLVDKKVKSLFLKKFLKNKIYLCIESNEKNKDFVNLNKCINFFIKNVSKETKVFAIGGGVVQDITSFLCSIYKRGVDWIFIPTTIISQADSCIGGKTSINFNGIKNQFGNFYPPKKIILNPKFISKLPKKQLYSGLGEMGHYYFLSNYKNYIFYKNNLKKISNRIKINLNDLIFRSLKIKKIYIEKDEFDKDERLKLNYGHTFGHALEKLTNLPHGIAVAHGMNIANYISLGFGFISQKKFNEMNETLNYIINDYKIRNINLDNFLKLLKKDKKSTKKNIRVILTKNIGNMFLFKILNEEKLKKMLKNYFI